MKKPIRIAVTGGGGQIAYQLLFRLAAGEAFGTEQPISLRIVEIPAVLPSLRGVEMELQDGAYPLLHDVAIGSDPHAMFEEIDIALLIGAKPRGPGMERKDLLTENAKIFIEQGRALQEAAKEDAHVFVIGNPCNTNAWIAMSQAPKIPRSHFFAMTTLDENRAKALLAKKAGVSVSSVQKMTVWGNHSATQVLDTVHATISGRPVEEVIRDAGWLQGEFQQTVQQRGAEVIKARGKSSAASAAQGIIDLLQYAFTQTPQGDWFSVACCSDGNAYGIEEDLIFSFPCRSDGRGSIQIIPDLPWNSFLQEKIGASMKELLEEKQCIARIS